LLGENKFDDAKKVLNKYASSLDELIDELKYHFFYLQGTFNIKSGYTTEALDFYRKAHELVRDSYEGIGELYLNIATCLSILGYTANAIVFLEDIHEISKGRTKSSKSIVNHMLANEHTRLGHLLKAKKLLDECYNEIMISDDKRLRGTLLISYGNLYRKLIDWNMALKYFDQALDCFDKGNTNYLSALYRKTLCYVEMKSSSACVELLVEGKKLSQESKKYTILFESLEHQMTPNDEKSINYLETIALPYFLEMSANHTALYYCEFLREHYEKKGLQKKTLQMTEIARTIYIKMLKGGMLV